MAWGFRKSSLLSHGVRLNLVQRSAGVSVGRRGSRLSANTSGQRSLTLSLLGLIWRKRL